MAQISDAGLLRQYQLSTTYVDIRRGSTAKSVTITHEIQPGERLHPGIADRVVQWKRREKLGRGTYGTVWLEEALNGQDVIQRAVKDIQHSGNVSYQHEILNMIRLSKHDSFVGLYHWFNLDRNVVSLAMEYCPSLSLQDAVEDKRDDVFEEREAKDIMEQLLSGLQVMHALDICHRDISLKNILVVRNRPRWQIKIADFGFAKQQSEFQTYAVGTPAFNAPEIRLNNTDAGQYTTKIDVWSAGCIAYRLLAGDFPFPTVESLRKYYDRQAGFPQEERVRSMVTSEGVRLLKLLLDPSPERRCSAEEALSMPWFGGAFLSVSSAQLNQSQLVSHGTFVTMQTVVNYADSVSDFDPTYDDFSTQPSLLADSDWRSNSTSSTALTSPWQSNQRSNPTAMTAVQSSQRSDPASLTAVQSTPSSLTTVLEQSSEQPRIQLDSKTDVASFTHVQLLTEDIPVCSFCHGPTMAFGLGRESRMFSCADCKQWPKPDMTPKLRDRVKGRIPSTGRPMHYSCALAYNETDAQHAVEHKLCEWTPPSSFNFQQHITASSSDLLDDCAAAFGSPFVQDRKFHTASGARSLLFPFQVDPGEYRVAVTVEYDHLSAKALRSQLGMFRKALFKASAAVGIQSLGDVTIAVKPVKGSKVPPLSELKRWSSSTEPLRQQDTNTGVQTVSLNLDIPQKQADWPVYLWLNVKLSESATTTKEEALTWTLKDITFYPLMPTTMVATPAQIEALRQPATADDHSNIAASVTQEQAQTPEPSQDPVVNNYHYNIGSGRRTSEGTTTSSHRHSNSTSGTMLSPVSPWTGSPINPALVDGMERPRSAASSRVSSIGTAPMSGRMAGLDNMIQPAQYQQQFRSPNPSHMPHIPSSTTAMPSSQMQQNLLHLPTSNIGSPSLARSPSPSPGYRSPSPAYRSPSPAYRSPPIPDGRPMTIQTKAGFTAQARTGRPFQQG